MSEAPDFKPNEVSVVMATNSVGLYFQEAVESVLATKGIDWELIIVFDGIPIPDLPKLRENPSVQLISKGTATGLPAALNLGISTAKYEYVARLDSDDLMLPERLLKQSNYLSKKPEVAIVGTSISIIDSTGKYIGENCHSMGMDLRKQLLLRNVIVHSSAMFRKSDWELQGGYFEELKQMEDYHFWLRLATIGEVHNLDDKLTVYRIHQNQMSKKAGYETNYINEISNARKLLGKSLNAPYLRVLVNDYLWKAAQLLRSFGLRKKLSFNLIKE